MASAPPDIPNGMRRVYRRFERWRSVHGGAGPPLQTPSSPTIPDLLHNPWSSFAPPLTLNFVREKCGRRR
jgi:hypothetical protein